jgi:hypothetical protein
LYETSYYLVYVGCACQLHLDMLGVQRQILQ